VRSPRATAIAKTPPSTHWAEGHVFSFDHTLLEPQYSRYFFLSPQLRFPSLRLGYELTELSEDQTTQAPMIAQRLATPIARAPRTSRTTRGGAKSSRTGPHSLTLPSGCSHASDSLPSKPPGLPYTPTRRASATRQLSRETSFTTIDVATHILAAPYFGPNPLFLQQFCGLLGAGIRGR
jgi:hypothetical protein